MARAEVWAGAGATGTLAAGSSVEISGPSTPDVAPVVDRGAGGGGRSGGGTGRRGSGGGGSGGAVGAICVFMRFIAGAPSGSVSTDDGALRRFSAVSSPSPVVGSDMSVEAGTAFEEEAFELTTVAPMMPSS